MKRKLLLFVCAVLTSGLNIVQAGDVKRNVTSLLTNASFDSDISGWTNNGFEHHSANGSQYNTGFAQKWSSDVRTGSIEQTISLPAGSYRFTANCVGGTDEGSGYDYLYAITSTGTTKADVEWISGDKANERTLNFSVPSTQSVTIGFQANSTRWWSAIDGVTLYAMDLSAASYDLPNTAVTAGTWYKFTTGSGSDAYTLSSSGDATITYTTDGTLTDDSGVTDTWTLTAKQNILLAPSTTYYIKSSAAVTLTKTESSVSSGYVSGWTKVTSLSDLRTNPENYFYAIFSANNPGLMVETNSSGVPYYLTATTPLSSSYYLYDIDNYTYNAESYFVLKSCGTSGYYHPVSGQAYNLHALSSKSTADDACRLTFEVANGVWNIKTWAEYDYGSYLGLWTPGNGYVNGEKMACNKTDAAKGSFLIYRIAKSNINATALIKNPSFESPTLAEDGTTEELGGWEGTAWTTKGEAFISHKKASSRDFSGVDGNNLYNTWGGTPSSNYYLKQTISKLPAGVYRMTCYVASDGNAVVNVAFGDESVNIDCGTDKTVGHLATVNLKKASQGDVTIQVSSSSWFKADNFQLTYIDQVANSADYTALSSAIATAEEKTLGFEDDEYAPYNNIAALTALAAAKAIDPDDDNVRTVVQTATSDLEDATWTANVGEVNAIAGGYNLDSYTNNGTYDIPNGWSTGGEPYGYNTRILNISESLIGSNPGLAGAVNERAILVKFSTTYGESAGYTMPLKANTVYALSFKYGLWNEKEEITKNLSVTDPNGATITVYPGSVSKNEGDAAKCANVLSTAWYDKTVWFETGATAGDYVLNITGDGNQRQMVFSGLMLKKAVPTTLADNQAVAPTAGLDYIAMSRTYSSSKWNTLCLPFALNSTETSSMFSEVKVLDDISVNGDVITMSFDDATEIAAGQPYLVKAVSDDSSLPTALRTIVSGTTNTVIEEGDYSVTYQGTLVQIGLTEANSDAWVVSNNNLYNVDSNVSVKANRAYFTVGSTSGVKSLLLDFDGETTDIKSIEGGQLTIDDAAIYNLAGQRMSKPVKGINIVNGKKVIIK